MSDFPIDWVRSRFPALERQQNGRPVVYFDGPAGSQVPASVAEAVTHALLHTNANHAGAFATSVESDAMLAEAHGAVADFLGASDPDCVSFGPNMTTLVLALSRALGRTWQPGDEIVLSRLDHDANVTPWVLAARDAGATVRYADVRPEDCTLDVDSLIGQLNEHTRLVAVGLASNLVGSINPVARIAAAARDVGALVFVDAVHYAPHARIDVEALGCNFLACSAYKFFGPHVGILWGRRELLEGLQPYKLRPAPDALPGRWMTGTQNHEGIAGTLAAVDYLADLGREVSRSPDLDRRAALDAAFPAIVEYEQGLAARLLEGLAKIPGVTIHGITESSSLSERVPTVAITHESVHPAELSRRLADHGIFTWSGHSYALPLTETLGLELHGVLRAGLLHYNTADELDRFLAGLSDSIGDS